MALSKEAKRLVAAIQELWDIRAQKGAYSPSTLKALQELREYVKDTWVGMDRQTRQEVEEALREAEG